MAEDPVQALRDAIRNLHGCDSTFIRVVPVRETFLGKVAWEGIVSVFDLTDHSTAKRAYAWSVEVLKGGPRRFIAVLHTGPVDSPENAVRAAIVAQSRANSRDIDPEGP
jgi:hypothetical protein